MKFSAALYAVALATSAIAAPVLEDRADSGGVVQESGSTVAGEAGNMVQVLEPETEADSTLTESLVVTINDPDAIDESTAAKKLKERINTTSANNVGYGKAIYAAVDAAYTQAKQIKNWDKARQAFTKGVVQGMNSRNPDRSRAKAAVCYNQGYRIRDPSNYYGLRSISFSSGLLKTNYDCFFLGNNNAFWYNGDGGFQNLAMDYPTSSCTWDRGVALTCM